MLGAIHHFKEWTVGHINLVTDGDILIMIQIILITLSSPVFVT